MLECSVDLRRGAFQLDIHLEVAPDEIVAVIGPNGAGKTTLLQIVAGLVQPSAGRLKVEDSVWIDTDRQISVPPEARRVGYVPQGGLLFPHLTVAENVQFGAPVDGVARTWLERLGIPQLADVRPAQLSGGQAQLVAFARAQARRPQTLLLDEPLSSVDVAHRAEVRRLLRRELREGGGYRLLVTHDPVEAAALADRIVVLDNGSIIQDGSMSELRRHPRSAYVAELVGVNFFRGNAADGRIGLDTGGTLVAASATNGPVLATVHPRAVSLYSDRPTGSPRNVWLAPITSIEPSLEQVRVIVGGQVPIVAEVTPDGAHAFREGQQVWVAVKASEVATYAE